MSIIKLGTPQGVNFRTDTSVTVANTVTETTIMTFTVPGNSLNTNNRLRMNFYGALSTIALLPGNVTIRLKLGTSVLTLGGGALALIGGRTNSPIVISSLVASRGTMATQFMYAESRQDASGLSLGATVNEAFNLPTVDMTVDQVFSLTVQFTVANAGNSFVIHYCEADLS